MSLSKLAAFSDGNMGGNPAGVYIANVHPPEQEMRAIAAELGYSETVFAHPVVSDNQSDGSPLEWRIRYFSLESEVPFCGHATIALGAQLAKQYGDGKHSLELNDSTISVAGQVVEGGYAATLQSPSTHSSSVDQNVVDDALSIFGYYQEDLDSRIPPAIANGGADHLIIALNSRQRLSDLAYDLTLGKEFMIANRIVTVMFVVAESDQLFHSRNAFASGGVYEDPATGAASAAFAGYLRDIVWPHGGQIDIIQGQDMGARSLIHAKFSNTPGESIQISGMARELA